MSEPVASFTPEQCFFRTEFKRDGSSVNITIIEYYGIYCIGHEEGMIGFCRLNCNVHLDSHCVCTINEALLLQATRYVCMYCVHQVQPLERID